MATAIEANRREEANCDNTAEAGKRIHGWNASPGCVYFAVGRRFEAQI